jgi:hypothetical protein
LINGKRASVVTNIDAVQQPGSGPVAAFVRMPFGGSVQKNFVILGLSQPLENVVRETSKLGWNTVQIILALVSRAMIGPMRKMVDVMSFFKRACGPRIVGRPQG